MARVTNADLRELQQELEDIQRQIIDDKDALKSELQQALTNFQDLKNLQEEAESFSELIENLNTLKDSFEADDYQNLLQQASSKSNEIIAYHDAICAPDTGIRKQITDFLSSAQNNASQITNIHHDITKPDGLHDNIRENSNLTNEMYNEIRNAHTEIFGDEEEETQGFKEQIEEAHKDIQLKHNKISQYFIQLFQGDAEENKKSVKEEINGLRLEIKALKQQVEDLLPEAATKGLASSYFSAKSYHGLIPKERKTSLPEKDGKWDNFLRLFDLQYSGYIKSAFFYCIFMGPIFLTLLLLTPAYFQGNFFEVIMGKAGLANDSFKWEAIFYRFIVVPPLALISWFGYTSIARSRRLYEEYDHKQRVMELYSGFRRELETFKKDENDDTLKELIKIVVTTVGDKPTSIRGKEQSSKGFQKMFAAYGKPLDPLKVLPFPQRSDEVTAENNAQQPQ